MRTKLKKDNFQKLNIFQVTLRGNIPTIKNNIIMFEKYYPNFRLFIICPKKDVDFFKRHINFKNCKIINEENVLPLKKFIYIANKYFLKNNYYRKIQSRLSWYYQQILKISFMIDFVSKEQEPLLMWDADAILLKRFDFFNHGKTIKYGTTFEFHRAYFETNKKILKELPKYFIAMTNQFIGLTPLENEFLIKKLKKIKKRERPTPLWISHIVSWAISASHKNFNGSMFSEQELIGQSNLLYSYEKQKLIHGLRIGLNGTLTNLQKKISIFFGYNYVSYEYSHPNINNRNMLNRHQSWFSFIKIILNKTSNKIFRGIKHFLNF